ncbi:MAG: hypothetical protein ACMUIG_08800 [Thermoplasmatota archaeon]
MQVSVISTAQVERISIYPSDLSEAKRDRLFRTLKKLDIHYSYEAY